MGNVVADFSLRPERGLKSAKTEVLYSKFQVPGSIEEQRLAPLRWLNRLLRGES